MTLADKILELRTGRGLSQGDLAEELEVSRQSVSKWETGQSVPELDKLIKLADLFGVSVDALVREGETPRSAPRPPGADAPPAAEPETKIVYVERPLRYTPVQLLGLILIAGGLSMILVSPFTGADPILFIGGALAILGLPLLLAKKHPFLIDGWLMWAVSYLLLCNPYLTAANWHPFAGIVRWCPLTDPRSMTIPIVWLMWLAYLGESALTLLLPVYTAWLGLKRWQRLRGGGTL